MNNIKTNSLNEGENEDKYQQFKFIDNKIKQLPIAKEIVWSSSLTIENIETYLTLSLGVINNIWKDFFRDSLHENFIPTKLEFIDDNFKWKNEYIVYHNWTIIVSKKEFITLSKTDIWVTAILAHEMWHHIARLQQHHLPKEKEEKFADFISWFTVKQLKTLWYLDELDYNNAKNAFYNFWIESEFLSIINWEINIHWNWDKREWSFIEWFNSSNQNVENKINPLKQINDEINKIMGW